MVAFTNEYMMKKLKEERELIISRIVDDIHAFYEVSKDEKGEMLEEMVFTFLEVTILKAKDLDLNSLQLNILNRIISEEE